MSATGSAAKEWKIDVSEGNVRLYGKPDGRITTRPRWFFVVTTKLLLDYVTSDFERVHTLLDWFEEKLAAEKVATDQHITGKKLDTSQVQSIVLTKDLRAEVKKTSNVNPMIIKALRKGTTAATLSVLQTAYRMWREENPTVPPLPPLQILPPILSEQCPSSLHPINTTFATLGDIYTYCRYERELSMDGTFQRVAFAYRDLIESSLQLAGKEAITWWDSSVDKPSSARLSAPARRKHLIWFHAELPPLDLECNILRPHVPQLADAIHWPNAVIPFLTLWLEARATGATFPNGGWIGDEQNSLSDFCCMVSTFAFRYRHFFSVTVAPKSHLYLLLYTKDGRAASLDQKLLAYLNLEANSTSSLTLEELKRYDVVVLPSLHTLKVDVSGHAVTVHQIAKQLKDHGIQTWPAVEQSMHIDAKDLFYEQMKCWDGFKEHSLPTEFVRFDDNPSLAELEQRLETAMKTIHAACSSTSHDVASGRFAFKPSEAFEKRGFQHGQMSDASRMIATATELRTVLAGRGYLLQPYSYALSAQEYRIFVAPFSGEIEGVVSSTPTVEPDDDSILFTDLTIDTLFSTRPDGNSRLRLLVQFVKKLVEQCPLVRHQVREGIITRLDCFIDKSNRVLVNEVTTGLDTEFFLAFREDSSILSRLADRIFSQVARLAFPQKRIILVLAMAFVSERYAQDCGESNPYLRDRARLLQLQADYSNEYGFRIITFNKERGVEDCEPGKHYRGDFATQRTVVDLIKMHPELKGGCWMILMDYVRMPTDYSRQVLPAFFKETLPALVKAGIVDTSTELFLPNFPDSEGKVNVLTSVVQQVNEKGHLDITCEPIPASCNPLYCATAKTTCDDMKGYDNADAVNRLIKTGDCPFSRLTVRDVSHLRR